MGRFDSVLFDFDGVLLDSEPIHYVCWADAVKPLGISITWEQYQKHCVGFHDRDVMAFLAGLAQPPVTVEAVRSRFAKKSELFVRRTSEPRLFSRELVGFLKSLSEYRLAVVTSSERAEIEPVLAAGGILGLFESVICAGDVARHKPAPDPYLTAAERLGVEAPLAVEDSELGVASAVAAGFEVVRVRGPAEVPYKVGSRLRG